MGNIRRFHSSDLRPISNATPVMYRTKVNIVRLKSDFRARLLHTSYMWVTPNYRSGKDLGDYITSRLRKLINCFNFVRHLTRTPYESAVTPYGRIMRQNLSNLTWFAALNLTCRTKLIQTPLFCASLERRLERA